ncbi:unnamed protein product [Closterium sp. NIES-54]
MFGVVAPGWTSPLTSRSPFTTSSPTALLLAPPPPLFLAPGPPQVDPLPAPGPAPSGVSQVDPSAPAPVEVTGDSGLAASAAVPGGAELGGAESGGAEREEPGAAASGGAASGGAEPACAEPGGAESRGESPEGSATAFPRSPWSSRLCPRGSTAGGSSAGVAGPGGARTEVTGAAGAGGVVTEGTGAAEGAGAAGGTGAAGGAGGAGAAEGTGATSGAGAGEGTGAAGGAGATGAGGTAQQRLFFAPPSPSSQPPPDSALRQVFSLPSSTGLPLQPGSPLPAPSPYTEQTRGLTERREPASRPVSPVRSGRSGRCVPRQRQPAVSGSHLVVRRPSSPPLRVPLPSPLASSLPVVADPASDQFRAEHSTVTRLLATVVSDPSFEYAAASALVAELVDFAAACRLEYATSLVAESESVCPPSIGGECALGTDVLEDRQEDLECLAAAAPHLISMLLAPEGDPDAPDIPTPRSYAEAIAGSPPVFKARYVARGFCQREGVDFFQTFSPTPKMTTLRVLLHVAAQRDYELHSLDFSTAFLQGSLHEEIWLRHPPGFTGSFPPGTQWSLQRPVYGLRQAPREWHDTLRTTLAALGFAPSTADTSLFLRTDTSLPPFYVLVYVDDLVFATADTEALALVKSELQKRQTCTDLAQATPLAIGHSLSAPPSDESVETSGPYPELVGCLMYLMTCTRPDLAYPLGLLARYVAPGRHRKVHMDAAKRVLRYLCSTSGMGLVLGGRGDVVLTGHSDASLVDDQATQRSSPGYTFSLGSSSVSWRSTRSSSFLGSSCEAEIYATTMAALELRWLTYLLTDLGERPRSPPVLYVDNNAAIALGQEHRLEHRTKHIALRYFLARELQQRGQLRLTYVATRANTADIFTKALPPVLPAVTLHCMGEQEATAVASVAGSWQYADLQRGTNSVPSVLRCVNAQSDSLVPSPSMASLASLAKGLLVNADQITAAADLFTSSSVSQQRMSQDSLLQPRDSQPQSRDSQPQSPDLQPQSRDSENQSQDLQLQSQGKSGWSSAVVLGSGLSVTAMAGAHMAAYGSPTYILGLLTSLGLSVDIRVLEASAFSLWHVSDGVDNQMSLLIFFLMTALCAAAAATLKLSPLPTAPRATISCSESESEQSSMASSNSITPVEVACDRVGQEEPKLEATPSSSGASRSSAWFSFSFSSRSATPPEASAPSPCTPSPHVVPEPVVARSATEPSTSPSSSSSSSSSGGGFFPSSISLPGYWFPFSASNSTSVTPSPSPAQSDSSTVSAAESTVSSEKSVTSLPALIAASPIPLAAPSAGLGLSSTRGSAFLRLDSEEDLSDASSDEEQDQEEEEGEEVRELECGAQEGVKAGLPLSRSMPSSLCLTLPRSMSMSMGMGMGMNISSSISQGLSSASSSAWSNVAQWSQSMMKSPVSLSLGDSPAVLVRSLSQLFSSSSRSMAALPTVLSESSLDDKSAVINSDPAELRDRAMGFPLLADPSLARLHGADARAVEAEVREATALVGTRDLAALMLRLDWSYDDEQGPWEMIIDKHSSDVEYMTWRRDPQDGGVTEYRSRIRFIGASARDTCAFYTDCAYMPRWDPMLRSMAPLLACPATGVQSACFERKYPFCAPREYVLAWRVWQQGESAEVAGVQGGKGEGEGEGETFFCITKAVEDASVPRKNKPRRVDVYRSEWRMKDVVLPGGRIAAEMDMIVQEDSGMQRDMAKLAYRRGAWGYIRSTDAHLRSYIKEHSPSHTGKQQACNGAVLEQVAGASPPRVLPPLSVVKQVPSHLIPEGTPDPAFHAHCQQTATAAPSFAMAAAVAEAQKLHAAGTAALHTCAGDNKAAAGSSAIEGVTGQSQLSQEDQQHQQTRGRRFRPLAVIRHLLMPAATVAAVGLGGGGLLCLNGGAVGTASKVLLVLTVRSLVLRPRASSINH